MWDASPDSGPKSSKLEEFSRATFKIPTQRAFSVGDPADGSNVTLDIQTLVSAERVLQTATCLVQMGKTLLSHGVNLLRFHCDTELEILQDLAPYGRSLKT